MCHVVMSHPRTIRAMPASPPSPPASTPFALPRADRLAAVPPFLFNQIDDKKRAAMAAGKDVINLGTGDPDKPTPAFIVERMAEAIRHAPNHQYPDGYGTRAFLAAAARFMERRFGVRMDPARHILATIGGKDGISHLPLGLLNPGDGAICFTPAYPVYAAGTILAGGVAHRIPTHAADGWQPRLENIPAPAAATSKLLWLNFPNNPTGATAPDGFFDEALAWCAQRNMVCASDLAYSEVYFGQPVRSLWQARGADPDRTPAIEFHSLSKTFNMTGWRIGFAVGHPDVIAALKQTKDNYDSGPFNAIQDAATIALDRFDDPAIASMRDEYRVRRDIVISGLARMRVHTAPPDAGIFVWAPCPAEALTGKPWDSWKFVARAIDEAAVVMVPGAGFADTARGHVRISLTRETNRIAEAMERLAALAW